MAQRCRLVLIPLALALALACARVARAEPSTPIYPLAEVRAGQRAVGKSVFRGTRIESFQIEVIGVLRKFDGARSIILGRILDGPVVERQSGVIGGMSGSPVYIEGRLAGAIALTWAWSKEPVAGITPIEDMLEAWGRPAATAGAAASGSVPPVRVGDQVIHRVRVAPRAPDPDPPGTMTLVPVGGFIQVAGFGRRGVERLGELLEPYGFHLVQGPGGGEESLRVELEPGAALGAQLVRGDFDMTALGTVTLVEGERVLGFGHPLFQLGSIDVPMTGGYVHDILPTLQISNKIMSPTLPLGRLHHDHQSAVAGRLGEQADLLPVSIEVSDRDLGRTRRFHLEVARVREMLPALVATSVLTAVDETRGRVQRGTARTTIAVEVEGREPLRREEVGYSASDAAAATAPLALEPLLMLAENPFQEAKAQRVVVRVEVEDLRKTAAITRVMAERTRVRAGEDVRLLVQLQPYGEEPVEVAVTLPLPADLPEGQVRVVVAAGRESQEARNAVGAPRPGAVSLDQLLGQYREQDRACDLVVYAALPRAGAVLLGEELPALPRSATEALRATQRTDLRPVPSLTKVVRATDWALSGRHMLALRVESRMPAVRPRPSRPPSEGPPEPPDKETTSAGGAVWLPGSLPAAAPAGVLLGQQPRSGAQPSAEDQPLSRAPAAWVHRAPNDYRDAELDAVELGQDGTLQLGLARAEIGSVPADVVWSVAARGEEVFVGTGTRGIIYRLAGGEASEFFATGEMNVHALAFDDEGNLWAGTSPGGKLFRISPEGRGELVADTESVYLWCLVMAEGGTVYAGAGAPARVYAIRPGDGAQVAAELPAANVLSLARAEDGTLYAGTSDAGIVYRIPPAGTREPVCQLSGPAVDALALGEGGELYAAASPGGDIWRIPASGLPEVFCSLEQDAVYGLSVLSRGDLVAATGPVGMVFRVGADRRPRLLFRPQAGTATALAQVEGALYLATTGPAVVYRLGPGRAEEGTVESGVMDAGRPARWGAIEWAAELPEGTSISGETRSGDSPDPRDGWSTWVPLTQGYIASPSARYLQYRLTLSTTAPAETPLVRQVRVSHRPRNQPPVCSLREPEAGARLSAKTTVTWQASDPDKDPLVYEVAVSPDLGATWEKVAGDLTDTKYEWDTTAVKDGKYLLRVTASDRRGAPGDAQQADSSAVVWVDNTPPEVILFRSSVSVGEGRRVRISGLARDALSPLRSAEYRVGEGPWESVGLSAIESPVVSFDIETEPLDPGEYRVQARLFDAAGNRATDEVKVTVPAEKPAGGEDGPREG